MGPEQLSYISVLALKARTLSQSVQQGREILKQLEQDSIDFAEATKNITPARALPLPAYKAFRWTKHGWHSNNIEKFPTSVKTSYISERFEPGNCGEAALLQQVQDAIQTGSPLASIDELPIPLRDLLQSPYDWHLKNGKLFRIVHPEDQARNGQWGSDAADADINVLDDNKTTLQLFLEQCGIIDDCGEEEAMDILGLLHENNNAEIIHTSSQTREDISITALTDDPMQNQPSLGLPIPEVDESIQETVRAIYQEYKSIVDRVEDHKELLVMRSALYKRINNLLSPYLTYPLNSPFCAHKYSPPRRAHIFIQRDVNSPVIDAAEEREKFFWSLFKQVLSVTSETGGENSLYGHHRYSGGGFYGLIRGMSAHDTLLKTEWSDYDKIDRKTGEITDSALKIQKREFIRNWRENHKGDEESLRVALWTLYDRVATKVAPIYKDSKLLKPGRAWKDSIWRQKRAKAYTELFLTASQWNAIYNMLNIQKRRIMLDTPSGYGTKADKVRQDTLKILRRGFDKIYNLSDLKNYKLWATKRNIDWKSKPAGQIIESQTDRLSIRDEHRWHVALATKERNLYMRLMLFQRAAESIQFTKPTDLPEQSIVCPYLIKTSSNNRTYYTPCDCMAIGIPQYAELEDNKGLLFIPCSGCGKKVWLIDNDKPLTPKLLTELESEQCV